MKPAFDPVLALSEDRRSVSAAGPYDVQDGDTDAYFWIRISQGEVEAIATHDQEEEDIQRALRKASTALRAAVLEAVGQALPTAGKEVTSRDLDKAISAAQAAAEAAMRESGPRWARRARARGGMDFRPAAALAEGWLLTKAGDADPGRSVFWRSDVTLAVNDPGVPPPA